MANNSRYPDQPHYFRDDPGSADRSGGGERYGRQQRGRAGGRPGEQYAGEDAGYDTSRWYEENSRGEMPAYLGESFMTHGYGGATGGRVDVRHHFGAGSDYGDNRLGWDEGSVRNRDNELYTRQSKYAVGDGYPRSETGGPADFAQRAGIYRGHGPKGYSRKDERIVEDVCEALSQDPYVDASAIEVKVKDGVVTLEGATTTRQMKHRAENCADACSGVKDIENHLRVRPADTRERAGQMGT